MRQKILTKCMHESVNRHIFSVVREHLVQKEQSTVVSPMLLANPQSLKVNVKMTTKNSDTLTS